MAKFNSLRKIQTYSLLMIFVVSSATLFVYAYLNPNAVEVKTSTVVEMEETQSIEQKNIRKVFTKDDAWETIYPNTISSDIEGIPVFVSVAKNWPDRIMGLSNTPYLPANVVKLFVFDTAGYHSIWMKDMKYSIDIIWADAEGVIIHLEENVSPESFPELFIPTTPAVYVVETVAGFISTHQIKLGNKVTIPISP